jgi:hypothetical protein
MNVEMTAANKGRSIKKRESMVCPRGRRAGRTRCGCGGCELDRAARLEPGDAVDDYVIAGLQSGVDDEEIAAVCVDPVADHDGLGLRDVLAVLVLGGDVHELALRAVQHRDLRHRQRVLALCAAQHHAHELAGLQGRVVIDDLGAHFVRAGRRIDPRVGEVDAAAARKRRAVGKLDRHVVGVVLGKSERARGDRAAQAQLLVFRNAEADPDRIGLRDDREQRVVRRGETALGFHRPARQAGDRRHDVGIAPIEFQLVEPRPRRLYRSGGELRVRRRVVGFLLPDRLALRQRGKSRSLAVGLRPLRLGLDQVRLGLCDLRGIGLRVNGEQGLAGLDRRSLLVKPLFDDPGHPSPNLDVLGPQRLTHVLESDGKIARRNNFRRYVGRGKPGEARMLLRRPAGGEGRGNSQWSGEAVDGGR